MKPLRIALCYDLKSDYLAAGFAPADVMEFDEEETIAALEGALRQLGHQPERVGRGGGLARPRPAGPPGGGGGGGGGPGPAGSPRTNGGTSCSISPRGCADARGRPRCRPSARCSISPTP